MTTTYTAWIEQNVGMAHGMCAVVTKEMQAAFPKLKRVRGHYYCLVWGERSHWWLVDVDGSIVDPTASQFPSRGAGHYEPWVEGSPEPTGKCPNCGELIWDGGQTCSQECFDNYVAYLADACR